MTPAILWIPFIAYWFLAARNTFRTRVHAQGRFTPLRGALYVAGWVLIFLSPSLGTLEDRFVPAVIEVGAAAWVLTAIGMLFAIWARITLRLSHR